MFNLSFFLFQDAATTTTETVQSEQNLIDLILLGGPLGVANVLVLLLLSVIAVYIFVERWLTISQAGKIDDNFINNIRAAVA